MLAAFAVAGILIGIAVFLCYTLIVIISGYRQSREADAHLFEIRRELHQRVPKTPEIR